MNARPGSVTSSGELDLPAEFLRAAGLEHGGDVFVELDGKTILIRSVTTEVADTEALTQKPFDRR